MSSKPTSFLTFTSSAPPSAGSSLRNMLSTLRGGMCWVPLNTYFAAQMVASDDSGQRLVMACGYDCVYLSNEYGAYWFKAEGLPADIYFDTVFLDASGQSIVLANTLRSDDFGVTWSEYHWPICPSRVTSAGDIWYVICSDQSYMYDTWKVWIAKSTDRGLSWDQTVKILELFTYPYAVHLTTDIIGQYVYVTTSTISGDAIYVSNDYGSTWNKSYYSTHSAKTIRAVHTDASGRYTIGELCGDANNCDYGLYSDDYGVSWLHMPLDVAQDHNYVSNRNWDHVYFIYLNNVYKTTSCPSELLPPSSPSSGRTCGLAQCSNIKSASVYGTSSDSGKSQSYRILHSSLDGPTRPSSLSLSNRTYNTRHQ
jgi:hypothetical protein